MTRTPRSDLSVGDRFGRWTVVGEPFKGEKCFKKVRVKCDCGTTRDVHTYNLQQGRTTSCGSCKRVQFGDRFGRLEALSEPFKEGQYKKVRVRCDCGMEKTVFACHLQTGATTSCGCYHKSRVRESHTTHGGSHTHLYHIWVGMVKRCTDPKNAAFGHYGARGIRVHDEWRESFVAFQRWAEESGYSDELTLDRIDTNDGYYPENCRFTTKTVQAQNCRKGRNNTSGFIGVSRRGGRYRAYACIDYRLIHLGYYSTPIEAARVRDDFVSKWYESPMLNFPEEGMKA